MPMSRDAAPVLASAVSMTSVLTESHSAEEEHAPSPKGCSIVLLTRARRAARPGGDERAAAPEVREAVDHDECAVSTSDEQREGAGDTGEPIEADGRKRAGWSVACGLLASGLASFSWAGVGSKSRALAGMAVETNVLR